MAEPRGPADESPAPEARALVDRRVAELGRAPAETVAVFRFLVAMAAVRLGEVPRVVRDGRPVVTLVDPRGERFYQLDDPRLGGAEAAAVEAMLGVPGGAPPGDEVSS